MNNPTHASSLTDVGRVRDHNEDTTAVVEPTEPELLERRGILGIVADGMGGFEAGEIASSRAVDAFVKTFYSTDGNLDQAFALAVRDANNAVREIDATRAGTTLVAAAVLGDHAFLANVGDSRAYMITPDAVRQITRDHSWVEDQVLAGHLTPEQARHHPRKNILTRALGSDPYVQADYYDELLADGCAIMLCSDGLHGLVEDHEIGNLVRSNAPERAALELISLANKRGGHDNISVVILRKGGLEGLQTGFKTVKATRGHTKWPWILGGSLLLFLGTAIAVALQFSAQVTPSSPVGAAKASETTTPAAQGKPTAQGKITRTVPNRVFVPAGAVPRRLVRVNGILRLISQQANHVVISNPSDVSNIREITTGTLRDVTQSEQNGKATLWVLTDQDLTKVIVSPKGSTPIAQTLDVGVVGTAMALDEYGDHGRLVFVSEDKLWRSQAGFVSTGLSNELPVGGSIDETATTVFVRMLSRNMLGSADEVALVVRGSRANYEYELFRLPDSGEVSGLHQTLWTELPYPDGNATAPVFCTSLSDGSGFALWHQGGTDALRYKTSADLKAPTPLKFSDSTQQLVSLSADGARGYLALLKSASGDYSWQNVNR